MSKYINILGIAIFFIFVLFSSVFAEEESFTITTYYPSPYGVYKNLRLYPYSVSANSDCTATNKEGDMAYSLDDHQPLYCDGYNWQPLGGGEGVGR